MATNVRVVFLPLAPTDLPILISDSIFCSYYMPSICRLTRIEFIRNRQIFKSNINMSGAAVWYPPNRFV